MIDLEDFHWSRSYFEGFSRSGDGKIRWKLGSLEEIYHISIGVFSGWFDLLLHWLFFAFVWIFHWDFVDFFFFPGDSWSSRSLVLILVLGMAGEDWIDLKFRLFDGTDIGPNKFNPSSSVASLKESILSRWPQGKRFMPFVIFQWDLGYCFFDLYRSNYANNSCSAF